MTEVNERTDRLIRLLDVLTDLQRNEKTHVNHEIMDVLTKIKKEMNL